VPGSSTSSSSSVPGSSTSSTTRAAAGSQRGTGGTRTGASGNLPRTGGEARSVALLGAVLVAAGALMRRSRKRSDVEQER
jgi:LPXTG-motif cell wall-anchored protein